MTGWISLHRKIQTHWIWQDPIKLRWWIDMLLTVNYADSKVKIGNDFIECQRGQSLLSLQSWGERWHVSKDTVRNFFTLLERDHMITRVSVTKSTLITICNFDSYNNDLHVKPTTSVRDDHPNNKEDKNNNSKGSKLPLSKREIYFLKLFNETLERRADRMFSKLDLKTRRQLADLLDEGRNTDDFIKTIKMARAEMTERGRLGYLTPEFITRPAEWEKYFNMQPSDKNKTEVYVRSPTVGIDHTHLEPVSHPPSPYNPHDE